MERISGDVRVALRSLRRSPTFAATTILILALGIGMSTAMFTVYKTAVELCIVEVGVTNGDIGGGVTIRVRTPRTLMSRV